MYLDETAGIYRAESHSGGSLRGRTTGGGRGRSGEEEDRDRNLSEKPKDDSFCAFTGRRTGGRQGPLTRKEEKEPATEGREEEVQILDRITQRTPSK